jgi:hypothetical protein
VSGTYVPPQFHCFGLNSSSSAHHGPLLDIGLSNFSPSRSILGYLTSSSCQPSCANRHSTGPEGVLHYVYLDAVSTPELINITCNIKALGVTYDVLPRLVTLLVCFVKVNIFFPKVPSCLNYLYFSKNLLLSAVHSLITTQISTQLYNSNLIGLHMAPAQELISFIGHMSCLLVGLSHDIGILFLYFSIK